ncbi:MAG: DUF4856 domain-containing protein [Flavobacteriales bacterium]|nr:DUF4856 domain-containing protein [Flavobacteriales bacterium]
MQILTKSYLAVSSILVFILIITASCNQNEEGELEVPLTYSFARNGVSTVDYSGQTERLDMLTILGNYLKTANTVGAAPLDADVLKAMFRNQNDPFSGQSFEKDLVSKCFGPDTSFFLQLFDDVALASQSSTTASNGVAGVLVDGSSDPNSGYRVNENGIEYRQVIIKGLMGAVFYYQAMEIYLSEDRMGIDGNLDFETGENFTSMEHYFDEAFGYFGIPTDYPNPVTLEDARFWGEYCNTRDEGLYPGINNIISTAFRTGRAAISAKDYAARDEAIQTLMQKWSVVIAASAVGYLNEGLSTSGTPVYKRHHEMSEAIGFMLALKYHFNGGNSKYPPHYTYSHIEDALAIVGLESNLYELSDAQIQMAIDHIKMAFPTGEIK